MRLLVLFEKVMLVVAVTSYMVLVVIALRGGP